MAIDLYLLCRRKIVCGGIERALVGRDLAWILRFLGGLISSGLMTFSVS